MRQLIIDTDPGIDDALALILASQSEAFEVVGITVVAGNSCIEETGRNALELLGQLEWDVPVAWGDNDSLSGKIRPSKRHGQFVLGNIQLSGSNLEEDPLKAWDYIYQAAKDCGVVDLLMLGPMTNLAKALIKYPDLPTFLGDVYAMGGGLYRGNVTGLAEFNFYTDPIAVDRILKAGLQLHLVGLNVTQDAVIGWPELDKLRNSRLPQADLIYDMLQYLLINGYHSEKNQVMIHDGLALFAYIYPEAFVFEEMYLEIELQGERRGMLRESDQSGKPIYLAKKFSQSEFRKYFMKTLMG